SFVLKIDIAIVDGAEKLSVSELLERANILQVFKLLYNTERNADPCTSRGCMWGKWTDGKVYIPYYISNQFSSREKAIITRGLESFSSFSCIRFRPSRSSDHDWLSIESKDGCYSYVGRRGGKQVVSLARRGCLYHGTVQHELLHALGFNHEQTRSDRDNHIKVMLQNIPSGKGAVCLSQCYIRASNIVRMIKLVSRNTRLGSYCLLPNALPFLL
uniref:Metalloendopeptidase n=1 Tax=Amphiprion percula TaxID=161767 RepID=A0A3P8S192_AMPPE